MLFLHLCCVFTSLSVFWRINVFIDPSVLGQRSPLVKWLTHLLRHPKLLDARLHVYLMKTVQVPVLWRCIPKSVWCLLPENPKPWILNPAEIRQTRELTLLARTEVGHARKAQSDGALVYCLMGTSPTDLCEITVIAKQ